MSDSRELYYAHMEADRNEAERTYFGARKPIDCESNRDMFRAGFERAYDKLWPLYGAPSTTGETSPAPSVMDRKVTVCNQCMCASCWQGQFYCEKAKSAGTITLTVRELRKSGNPRESVEYWFKDPATGVIDRPALADYRTAVSETDAQT